MSKIRIKNFGTGVLLLTILIAVVSCSTLNIPSGYTQYNADTSNIFIRNDEFKNVSFIQHKYFFNIFLDQPLIIYIAKNQNTKFVRAKFSYDGSDWIFFEDAIIVNSNGERMSWTFKSYEKNTDIGSGGHVYENIDIVLSADEVSKLIKLIGGNNVKIRLSGKYYKEYSLDADYINALREILEFSVKL
jgi:hypothetical protein